MACQKCPRTSVVFDFKISGTFDEAVTKWERISAMRSKLLDPTAGRRATERDIQKWEEMELICWMNYRAHIHRLGTKLRSGERTETDTDKIDHFNRNGEMRDNMNHCLAICPEHDVLGDAASYRISYQSCMYCPKERKKRIPAISE